MMDNPIRKVTPKGPYVCPLCGKLNCLLIRNCEDCNAYKFETLTGGECTYFKTSSYEIVCCKCNADDVARAYSHLQDLIPLQIENNNLHVQLNYLRNELNLIEKRAAVLLKMNPQGASIQGIIHYLFTKE